MLACLCGLATVCSLFSESLPLAGMWCAHLYIEPFLLTTVIMYEHASSNAELFCQSLTCTLGYGCEEL